MQTCELCGREHKGRGRMCAACNSGKSTLGKKTDPRKYNDRDRTAHMDYAEGMARADDEGWFYDDDED